MPLPRIATPWSLPPGKALANQAKGTWWVGFSQGSWDEETFLLVLVDPRPSQGSLEGGREAGRSEPEKDMWWERERKPEQTGEDSARPALRSCREPGTQEASCRHWKSPGKRLSPGTPSRSTALTTLDGRLETSGLQRKKAELGKASTSAELLTQRQERQALTQLHDRVWPSGQGAGSWPKLTVSMGQTAPSEQ